MHHLSRYCFVFLSLALSASAGRHDRKLPISDSFETIEDDCEASCPACPDKDTSLYDSTTGELINAGSYGEWVVSTSCDDKLYLFSDCGLDWFDARDKCCKLGMNLISLPSQDEYDCFSEANTDTSGQWWTSATDEGCTYKSKLVFSWCSEPPQLMDNVYSSSDEDLHTWRKKEPNNAKDNEKCVRLETDGGNTYLTDKSCHNMYKYVCEGGTTTAPATSCTADDVACPNRPAFNSLANIDQYGSETPDATFMLMYMISTVKKTWSEAFDICASAGWDLITIESSAKFNSFALEYNMLTGNTPTQMYWTSGTDAGCPAATSDRFKWCSSLSSATSIDSSLWEEGEPNFATPNEKCVALQQLGANLVIKDTDCTVPQFFVCESNFNP